MRHFHVLQSCSFTICNYEPEEDNKTQEEVQRMRESDERLLANDHRINSAEDSRRTKRGASDV